MSAALDAAIADLTRGWDRAVAVRGELKRLEQVLGNRERLVNVDRVSCTGRDGLLASSASNLASAYSSGISNQPNSGPR